MILKHKQTFYLVGFTLFVIGLCLGVFFGFWYLIFGGSLSIIPQLIEAQEHAEKKKETVDKELKERFKAIDKDFLAKRERDREALKEEILRIPDDPKALEKSIIEGMKGLGDD